MIDRVYRGWKPGGLVEYLFGPGRYNEHENPRLVATWDGRPEQWRPESVGPGEFDWDLDALIAAMQAPLKAARLPVTNPNPADPRHRRFFKRDENGDLERRPGPVFHLTLRNAADDRVLSDAEWRHIAEEMMHRTGIARRGDAGACRWIAVRHDDEGIHVMATLVRQDTARRVHPSYYLRRLRETARAMEKRYGLTVTAAADRTAACEPGRGEYEKAARQGRRAPTRVMLREQVAQAAAASANADEFAGALREAGVLVEISYLPSGALRGLKVADPSVTDTHGVPIWFRGSDLASDLSMPKLVERWSQAAHGQALTRGASGSSEVWVRRTMAVVERARLVLREDPARVNGLAHAVGEVYAVLDANEGRVVHSFGAQWDRASRAPHRPVPETCELADELRSMARGLRGARESSAVATVELVAALSALALQISALLGDDGREQQARAARRASRGPARAVPARPPSRPISPTRAGSGRIRARNRPERPAGRPAQRGSWSRRSSDPPDRGRGR